MDKKANNYTGKAGQLAVMAEFLMRGWNVAIPEVDVGDDIFVVQDDKGILRRVQVKTALSMPRKSGYAAQFHIPATQVARILRLDQHFVFAVRHHETWTDYVILHSDHLMRYFLPLQKGSSLKVHLVFDGDKVLSGKEDFSVFRNNFSDFPPAF